MTVPTKPEAFLLPKPLPDELLVQMVDATHDPVQVMRFAEDYYAFGARLAERHAARLTERRPPPFPRPRSVYMRQLLAMLAVKLSAFVVVLTHDEIARLGKIAPEFLRRVREGDGQLGDQLVELFSLPLGELASWVREHLPALESRLAS